MDEFLHQPDYGTEDRSQRPSLMPLGMALAIAIAIVGIYHDPQDVGLEIYDFAITTEFLAQQDSTDDQVQVGTPQKKICFAALALIGFYLAFVKQPKKPYHPNAIAWLALGCISWAAITCLWSVEPPVTLRELIRLSVIATTAYGIARCYDPNQMMFVVLVVSSTSVLTALGSEAMVGYLRPWGADYRLQGGMHANMVAVHAAMMALAGLGMLRLGRHRGLLWLIVLVGVGALIITKSRSAAGVFLVATLVQWSLRLDSKRAVGYWASIASVLAVLLFAWAVGGSQLQRAVGGAASMGREDQVGTLTGRLPLWRTVASEIASRPLLGHGYEAFWTAERRIDVAAEVNWYPTDAHSIYVNTALEQGAVGLGLNLILAWWAAIRLARAYQHTQMAGYAFFATLIAFALIHGLTEAGCSAARVAGLCIGAGVLLAGGTTIAELPSERDIDTDCADPPLGERGSGPSAECE